MDATWLHLIRHGEVERAAERRFLGHTDVALSATGLTQVQALARRLGGEPIEAVYASDLLRARQSAAPLAAERRVAPVADPAFREMAMGRWEGLTFEEIRAREPEAAARWLGDPATVAFPAGERLEALRGRVLPALARVLARHRGGHVALVAHGGPNRVILGEALGLPLRHVLRLAQDYGAWSLVEYHDGAAVVHTLNQRTEGATHA
jgi:alpha-ribazole phosphatase